MQKSIAYIVSILFYVLSAFSESGSTASGAIRGDVFTKGTNREPAVLPGVPIVLHRPTTKETESDAEGAFANANALGKFANRICELLKSFEDDPEILLTEDDRKWLNAMDCAFGRKVHRA